MLRWISIHASAHLRSNCCVIRTPTGDSETMDGRLCQRERQYKAEVEQPSAILPAMSRLPLEPVGQSAQLFPGRPCAIYFTIYCRRYHEENFGFRPTPFFC